MWYRWKKRTAEAENAHEKSLQERARVERIHRVAAKSRAENHLAPIITKALKER